MKILVTGAAGFIGSHLCEKLLSDGHTVVGLDNFSTGDEKNCEEAAQMGNFQLIYHDLREPIDFAMSHIDAIVHLAAAGSVPRSMAEPTFFMSNNVMGFQNIMDFARKHTIKTVLYASSSSVYGDGKKFFRYETDAVNPLSPYAATKAINEIMAKTYEKCFGISSFGLRFFNVFGPRQNMASEYAAVIPKFCQSILTKSRVTIYGDGQQVRTFTPVDFVTESIASLLTVVDTLNPQILNITHPDYATNVLGIAKAIGTLYRTEYVVDFAPRRRGDVMSSIGAGAELSKAIGDLSADFSMIENLRTTCEWYKKQLTLS